MNSFAIGIGGALGALVRFVLGEISPPSSSFPFVTMLINFSGSFVFAVLSLLFMPKKTWLKLGMTTGFLGGFTTFSTFSIETVQLIEQQLYAQAALYSLTSLFGSIACCYLAYSIIQRGGKVSC